jgi:hypothetical protein
VNRNTGMLGVTDAKKREIQAVEKRELKRADRDRLRNQWKVNKQANSQKHFRVCPFLPASLGPCAMDHTLTGRAGPSSAVIRSELNEDGDDGVCYREMKNTP